MANVAYQRPRNDDEVKELAAIFDEWRAGLPDKEKNILDWYVFQLTSVDGIGEASAKADLCKVLAYYGKRKALRRKIEPVPLYQDIFDTTKTMDEVFELYAG